jgi:O-antigen/teichoic acid export membrane protein
LRTLPVVPFRWNKALLFEMIGYGLSFQVISVMGMLLDPVAKALLSKFGGLDALGFYEMANKLILQARSIIVEAVRFLIPSIAALPPEDTRAARDIFVEAYRVIFYVAIVFFGLLGTGLTAISLVWIGRYEYTFVLFALVLNAAWFINTLVVPAYFSNLGRGHLRANVISHVIIGGVASVAGGALGALFGGPGVVGGTALGLVSGSLFLTIGHFVVSGINWRQFIVPAGMSQLTALAAGLVLLANGYGTIDHSPGPVIVTALGCSALLFAVGWLHPLRAHLLGKTRGHPVPDTLG